MPGQQPAVAEDLVQAHVRGHRQGRSRARRSITAETTRKAAPTATSSARFTSVRRMRRESSSTTVRMRRSPRPASIRMRSTPVREPPQVGEHGGQLVADHLVAGRGPGVVLLAVRSWLAAATIENPGEIVRSVPSRVTSARDRITRSPGRRMPNSGQRRHQVLQHRRVDRAGRPHVLGHQPGEGPLEALGRHRLRHLGHPLDAVAEQADVAPHAARPGCRSPRPAGSGRAGRRRRSR